MIAVDNLALELLDPTQVPTWWSPILRGYSLPVLIPVDMVPIDLLEVSSHVAYATEHGTTVLLILHLALSSMSLLLYSSVTVKF